MSAANSVSYSLVDSSFTVTDSSNVVHDLSGIMLPPLALSYERSSQSPVIRVGLLTASFIVTLPNGETLTLDSRIAKALGQLGWNVPRV
jgi:hypothetical protein